MPKKKSNAEVDERLQTAVVDLRKRLGLTQTKFAAQLDMSVQTIQRWETLVPPKGSGLIKLGLLAEAHTTTKDLVDIFRAALDAELLDGKKEAYIHVLPDPVSIGCSSVEEADELQTLLDILHEPRWKKLKGEWNRISRPVKDARKKAEEKS